jgi:hypothetical protein
MLSPLSTPHGHYQRPPAAVRSMMCDRMVPAPRVQFRMATLLALEVFTEKAFPFTTTFRHCSLAERLA